MLFAPVATYRRPALQAFERFLDDVMRTPTQAGAAARQDDQAFELSLDMPGVAREQVKIDVEGQTVRIETVAGAPRQYRGVYELPQEIDAEASSAKLENGVLSLRLAKVQPVSKARSISVA